MIRATTGGVLRTYRKNLMSSFIASNKARETVLTQRNFNSYAEDPAAAAKAFRLRKSRLMVKSQHDVCQDTYSKFQGAFSSLDTIDKLIDTENGGGSALSTLKGTTLKMLNDPEGDARTQLAKVLDNLSDTIVQNMNQKYGDDFIFAGADGHNVPFEVKEVDGHKKLYYRGVPVDAEMPDVMTQLEADGKTKTPIKMNANGEYDPAATGDGVYYLKSDDVTVMSKEEYEKLYVVPTVNSGADGPIEYNADGTPRGEGGYYWTTDGNGRVSIADYEAADPKPTNIELDAEGKPKEYNADGTAYGAGGYYIDVTDPNDMKPISIADYEAVVARSKNAPTIVQDAAGGNLSVDEKGAPTVGGTSYLIVKGDPKEQLMSQKDYDAAKTDAEKLAYLMNEKRFVDIGLGFQENENGELIESSAFNEALNGLTFLGCGLDEDGDPKNIYSIVQRLKEISESVPNEGQWSEEVYNEFNGLVLKLEDASSSFKTEFTNMDAGTTKLKNNLDLLEDNFYNLQEQYAALEDVDMADAITSFIWAEYCYNAALKVGNSILSQSLMDYLQ